MINKRYTCLTKETIMENPNLLSQSDLSLNTRLELAEYEVPKLGKEAAEKAITEWGQSKTKITHLVMCSISVVEMPGMDYQLVQLLGLCPEVKRFMLYLQGCHGGGSALRLAKDLAENNQGARVLVVCSEMNSSFIRGPDENDMSSLVGHAIFADGAAAVVVGADPIKSIETPLFQMVWTGTTILPNSKKAISLRLRETGPILHLDKDIPLLISKNIGKVLNEAFHPLGISDWNSIFWVTHPGGATVLNQVEAELNLKKEKLISSRNVLRDFGNMASATVFFVLDEMRTRSLKEGHTTTGEGLDWGVLFGFGPGFTIETVVLHSVLISPNSNVN